MFRPVFIYAALLLPLPVLAAEPPAASPLAEQEAAAHHPLVRSDALTLAAVIDRACAWLPDHAALQAEAALARTERRQADRWIPESPSLGLLYQSDQSRDQIGLEQQEVALKLPLWNWGERSATQAWADARGAASESMQAQYRWLVAGRVREALWTIELAGQALASAREQQQILVTLQQQVQHQHRAGDVARIDLLLVEQELTDARQSTLAADAVLRDAQRGYYLLTGLDRMPAHFTETAAASAGLSARHPALHAAAVEVDVARRALDMARNQPDSRPTLSFNVKRERAEDFGPVTDSAGIAIEWPLDIGGRHPVRNATADRDFTNARVAQQNLMRELQGQLHEALHQLHVLHDRLLQSERGRALAAQQWQMQQLAYRSGEIGMQELLLSERRYITARSQYSQLQLEHARAIARFNQVVGELP